MAETVSLERLHKEERILVTAHRGNSVAFPENTLLSMTEAVKAGTDFIEFDLRSTSDHVPILLHDETLERTANVPGTPEEKSFAELKKLNASWFRYQRRQSAPLETQIEIPSFEEILDALSDKAAMNIQMYVNDPAALKEACRLYKKYDMYDKGYMTIAAEEVVEAVHAIDKDIAICLTPGWSERITEESQRRCAALGCRFFQPIRSTLTPELLQLSRELGLRANTFYADTETDFAGLYNMGVQGIMTNAPARLVEWLKLQK